MLFWRPHWKKTQQQQQIPTVESTEAKMRNHEVLKTLQDDTVGYYMYLWLQIVAMHVYKFPHHKEGDRPWLVLEVALAQSVKTKLKKKTF